MDNIDSVLGDLASGDLPPVMDPAIAGAMPPPLKREHDSTDDFEHLDRERQAGETPSPLHAARAATMSFLDTERGPDPPRAPSATDRLADKFTDSDSDADTAGESPLHRAVPPPPTGISIPPGFDSTPLLIPEPAPRPPEPAPKAPEPVSLPAPKPAPEPVLQTEAKPQPPPQKEPPKVASTTSLPTEVPRTPVAHVIEAEVIFCQMGLDAWFDPQRLHPEVESLIYWRCPARSGGALGAGLALLVALACCSVVSVLAYASLLTLTAAVGFRIYKNVLQAIQKTNEGHPFKWLLEQDISLPAERSQSLAAAATAHLNAALSELRRLFLVEDLVDSLKFGVLLWCLTYVGACFNGITLIILGWIALFTLPKAYEMNKPQVDANLELARAKINEITAKVRAAVPLGRKAESEKDK